MNTGYWNVLGTYIVSDPSKTVSSTTGLGVLLLGETGGYRVFYRDIGGALRQLGYTAAGGSWSDVGLVNQDKSSGAALGVVLSFVNGGNGNMTVFAPKDKENIEATRWYSDNAWRMCKQSAEPDHDPACLT